MCLDDNSDLGSGMESETVFIVKSLLEKLSTSKIFRCFQAKLNKNAFEPFKFPPFTSKS